MHDSIPFSGRKTFPHPGTLSYYHVSRQARARVPYRRLRALELPEVRDQGTTDGGRVNEPSLSDSPFLNTLEILGLRELERICLSSVCVCVCGEETERKSVQRSFGQAQNDVCVPLHNGR